MRPKPRLKVIAAGTSAARWQQRRRAELRRLYPDEGQGDPHISNLRHRGTVTWTTQVIEYPGWPGAPPQRAILRIPHGARRAPALLTLHGHSRGLQLGCVEMAYLAEPLAAAGFVTLAPDALPFGDRRLHLSDAYEKDFRGFLFWDERAVASECWLLGETLLGRQLWELMVSVDLLQSFASVDPRRIGTIGCSQGGLQSWWLSVVDSRIAAAAVSAGISTYREWIKTQTINALFSYVPGILKLADQDELIATIAPRPLHVFDCAQDGFFPRQGFEQVHRFVQRAYRRLGAAQNYRHDVDTGAHGFPARQQKLAREWLTEVLASCRAD